MKRRTLLIMLLSISTICQAKSNDFRGVKSPTVASATSAAQKHVRNFMEGQFNKLERTYAAQIKLISGHEMLKAKYNLAGEEARKAGVIVNRAKLVEAMKKSFGGRPVVPVDAIDAVFNAYVFEVLETPVGDYATDPPDPVATPDGKIHFSIEPGDLLFKVGPKKGDFLLFQFRSIAGSWKVVAEYLD